MDYWFIPNKYWEIKEVKENEIILKATYKNEVVKSYPDFDQVISLRKRFFLPSMFNSLKDYKNSPPIIENEKIHRFFLVNKYERSKEMKIYYNWGVKAHEIKMFGKGHSGRTPYICSGGIVTKINYLNTKTVALLFDTPVVGSRIIWITFHGEKYLGELFFAYLSSSIFFLDVLEKSRTRCAEFVSIEHYDFIHLYKFPDLHQIIKQKDLFEKIIDYSRDLNSRETIKQRPRLINMIMDARINSASTLRKLDETWFTALNIPQVLIDSLYQEIEERLSDILEKR